MSESRLWGAWERMEFLSLGICRVRQVRCGAPACKPCLSWIGLANIQGAIGAGLPNSESPGNHWYMAGSGRLTNN